MGFWVRVKGFGVSGFRVLGFISVMMTRSMGGIPIAKRKTLDLQHGAPGPESEIVIAKPPSPYATITGL